MSSSYSIDTIQPSSNAILQGAPSSLSDDPSRHATVSPRILQSCASEDSANDELVSFLEHDTIPLFGLSLPASYLPNIYDDQAVEECDDKTKSLLSLATEEHGDDNYTDVVDLMCVRPQVPKTKVQSGHKCIRHGRRRIIAKCGKTIDTSSPKLASEASLHSELSDKALRILEQLERKDVYKLSKSKTPMPTHASCAPGRVQKKQSTRNVKKPQSVLNGYLLHVAATYRVRPSLIPKTARKSTINRLANPVLDHGATIAAYNSHHDQFGGEHDDVEVKRDAYFTSTRDTDLSPDPTEANHEEMNALQLQHSDKKNGCSQKRTPSKGTSPCPKSNNINNSSKQEYKPLGKSPDTVPTSDSESTFIPHRPLTAPAKKNYRTARHIEHEDFLNDRLGYGRKSIQLREDREIYDKRNPTREKKELSSAKLAESIYQSTLNNHGEDRGHFERSNKSDEVRPERCDPTTPLDRMQRLTISRAAKISTKHNSSAFPHSRSTA